MLPVPPASKSVPMKSLIPETPIEATTAGGSASPPELSPNAGCSASDDESDEPITPLTRPQDTAQLPDVLELSESERVGEAAQVEVRKQQSSPARTLPGAIIVRS